MSEAGPEPLLGAIFDHLSCGVVITDAAGQVLAANRRALELLGTSMSELEAEARAGQRWLLEDAEGRPIERQDRPAVVCLTRGPIRDFMMSLRRSDGRRQWLQVDALAMPYPGRGMVAVTTFVDVTQRHLAQVAVQAQTAGLEERHRQQAAIADLGREALTGAGAQDLMERAAALVARTLDADSVRVLELLPDGETLLLRAGVGWHEGLVGHATIPAEHSQAGYLLRHNEPIVIEDFRTDSRFRMSWLLRQHEVVSGIRAVIRGDERPFGELAAYTRRRRSFSDDDVRFMRAMANVLAEAILRRRATEEVEHSLRRLRQTDESRRQLLRRLVSAVEGERRRIAEDVHDDPIQMMTAFGIRLQLLAGRLPDPEVRRTLNEVTDSLGEVTARLRRLIFDLRPDALDLGLAEAIGYYYRHTRSEGDPELDVDSSLDRDVPQETRLTIYRACQEALNNARRHARASRVLVRLRERQGGVLVEISDDGAGFRFAGEHPPRPGHLGLVAMRERAELAGGRFDIHARPDAGTTVEMWFPLPVESEGRPTPPDGSPHARPG